MSVAIAQEHTGNTGMDQLLGALGPELEAHEAEEGSDLDDDAVSGTDQGAPPIVCTETAKMSESIL